MFDTAPIVLLHVLVELALIVRVLLRPNRQPASRIAWVAVIAGLPLLGIVAYVLFGEVRIGRRRGARLRGVLERMPEPAADAASSRADVPERYEHLFKLGHSISGFDPVGGNSARLLADSNAAIDAMVDDIDGAKEHVHLLFYIWLTDGNGCKMVGALKRAAARGVRCRAMVDGLGSRSMLRSAHWAAMREAGVELAAALPIGNPLLRAIAGRIDLRWRAAADCVSAARPRARRRLRASAAQCADRSIDREPRPSTMARHRTPRAAARFSAPAI